MPHKGMDDRLTDRERAEHMLWAARDAMSYLAGRTRMDVVNDSMFRRALVNCLQEIGEAAARMSDDGRARCAALPWTKIVGMRHILVHVYHDLDHDTIWKVASTQLRPMVEELDCALKNWPA